VAEPERPCGPIDSTLPRRPEYLLEFRLARLLLLLDSIPEMSTAKPLHIERLGYYDFFVDNPFLVFEHDAPERIALQLAGFSERTLSYSSSAQRFNNRRERLRHDLALLLSKALIEVGNDQNHVVFSLSEAGGELGGNFSGLYARSYRESAALVIRKLNRISDKALGERSREWLRADPFLLDLYGEGQTAEAI
jgi:hypothetical protein